MYTRRRHLLQQQFDEKFPCLSMRFIAFMRITKWNRKAANRTPHTAASCISAYYFGCHRFSPYISLKGNFSLVWAARSLSRFLSFNFEFCFFYVLFSTELSDSNCIPTIVHRVDPLPFFNTTMASACEQNVWFCFCFFVFIFIRGVI